MYTVNSSFPTDVDPLIYFQDLTAADNDIVNSFISYVNKGDYDSARALLQDKHSYSADLFNMMQNRILTLQTKLKPMERTSNDFLYFQEDTLNANPGQIYIEMGDVMKRSDAYPDGNG
jgi:hypothetical protein